MVIFLMENVPPSLRGELTRWMIEAKAGVFIGNMSAAVRERLWDKIIENSGSGGAIIIHSSDTEQGYKIRMHGNLRRNVVDIEGIQLIKSPI